MDASRLRLCDALKVSNCFVSILAQLLYSVEVSKLLSDDVVAVSHFTSILCLDKLVSLLKCELPKRRLAGTVGQNALIGQKVGHLGQNTW